MALAGMTGCVEAAQNSGNVVVTFDHPEKFTDVKDRYEPTDSGQAGILNQIKEYIVYDASNRLPAGDTLSITFTDIKLAGDFEPWHNPARDDIRYVRDIYPPRYKFTYALTDAAGHVIRQGSVNDTDLNFQTRMTLDSSDPLHYEKAYLDDWIRGTTHGLK